MTETATAPAPPKKARTGVPKSTGFSLNDAQGNQMRIVAVAKKDGTATTYVVHRVLDADKKVQSVTRGATQVHASLDVARSIAEKLKEKAVAAGWLAKQSRVGKAKPDAFTADALPAPKKTPRK